MRRVALTMSDRIAVMDHGHLVQAEIAAAGSPEGAYALLDAVAAAAPPGCRGLVFLPTMNGSSAPLDRPQASGSAWSTTGPAWSAPCWTASAWRYGGS